jgi:SAM-dependent methyltransferase
MADTDRKSRQRKADKIISILRDVWPDRLATARCLDLGCGIGVTASQLSLATHSVVAMDSEWFLVSQVPQGPMRLQGNGLRLPFNDATFDVVACAQVYEHVTDPAHLIKEITRVLKPGGICYFSGPNRLWPYEYHYRTCFVHWLPHKWHSKVLGLFTDDAPVHVTLYTIWQLRRLWEHFDVRDYTVHLVCHPDRFPGADAPKWIRHIPAFVLAMASFATPNVNWVLVKPINETEQLPYEDHRHRSYWNQ